MSVNITNPFHSAIKEKLRSKIIARLMKEGSNAEEPTNIDLTDYSSDEGDTSDSSTSEKEDIDFAENIWSCTVREPMFSPQYLCAPPPTPTFVPPRSFELAKRRCKKRTTAGRSYLRRKSMLARRAVMDLPTTDPGSDLYDYTDSADEEKSFTVRIREYCNEETIQLAGQKIEDNEKSCTTSDLVLPEINKACSRSLVKNLTKEKSNTNRRSHLRLVRTLRHRSPIPLKSRDIQIKVSSLRQQIWLGVPLSNGKNIEESIEHSFGKGPLSWGVSNMALSHERISSDELLKSCTKKLQSLEYINTVDDTATQNEYKYEDTVTQSRNTSPELEGQHQDIERKPKKKKSCLKWQKIVDLNSRVNEMRHGKKSFLTIKADSLKVVTLKVPSKLQVQQHQMESRRKHRKNGGSCAVSNIGKTSSVGKSQMRLQSHPRSHVQLQPLIVPLCDSFSSDTDSSDSRKQRATKKKQKKKKQPKKIKTTSTTAATGRKKRITSANTLRNA